MKNLPINWTFCKISEVIDTVSVVNYKIKKRDYLEKGLIPVIDQGEEYIGGYTNDQEKRVPCELPVVIFGDHTRKFKYVDRVFAAGADGIKVLKPWNNIDEKYFFYAVQALHIPNKGYARHFQYLAKADLPIPPINEQVRIVSKIEKLVSRLDQGIKDLLQTQQQLEQYRQSLFNDLFSSKFDIYRKITLGNILVPSKERFNPLDNKEAACIGLADIESNTGRILNIGKSSETKSLKSVFNSDDLLYGRLRPYLNKVAVPNFNGVCSTDIIVFKSSDKINHNFLQYALMSNNYVSYATNNMSGVQHPRVKFDEMAKFVIPYPPLDIQNKIHMDYEKRLSIINNMIFNIEQSKSQSELLRQLILRKAFEGCLVPQDFNDEPASVLLERIKAEKVKLKVTKRRGKRRRKS